jgi:hypothetical protein
MLFKFQPLAVFILLSALLWPGSLFAQEPNFIGKKIPDFQLRNIDQTMVSLSKIKNAKGYIIVFTCNHCPFAKLYTKRLNALNQHYQPMRVPLIAINSMDSLIYREESFSMMQKKARSEKYNFSYLQDASQSVGKIFDAKHTPQAFVVWKEKEEWVLKYAGAIDDNGENPSKARSYVREAVDELLAGKPVAVPETASFGCRIFYRKNQ